MQSRRLSGISAYTHFGLFMFHDICMNNLQVSILPPTHINTVASDGFVRASKAPNTSPLVVFVNSKSGDNQVS